MLVSVASIIPFVSVIVNAAAVAIPRVARRVVIVVMVRTVGIARRFLVLGGAMAAFALALPLPEVLVHVVFVVAVAAVIAQ